MTEHLLSITLFLPLAGMLLLLLIPETQARTMRLWSLGISLATLAFSLIGLSRFDSSAAGFQLSERAPWIPTLGVQYAIGIDGISLLLVLLTTVIFPLVFLASWNTNQKVKAFHALFLLIETATLGVFLALDGFLFYLFFDLVLIPMYFVIALWGGPGRLYASLKFFLYTLCGSVLMLLGLIGLYLAHIRQFGTPSFEIAELMKLNLPLADAAVDLLGFVCRLRDQDPDVPLSHLATRRSRGSTDGGFGRSGKFVVEAGDLRISPVFSCRLCRRLRRT